MTAIHRAKHRLAFSSPTLYVDFRNPDMAPARERLQALHSNRSSTSHAAPPTIQRMPSDSKPGTPRYCTRRLVVLASCFQAGSHHDTQASAERPRNKGKLSHHTNILCRALPHLLLDLCADSLSLARLLSSGTATLASRHLTCMGSSLPWQVFTVLRHCNS